MFSRSRNRKTVIAMAISNLPGLLAMTAAGMSAPCFVAQCRNIRLPGRVKGILCLAWPGTCWQCSNSYILLLQWGQLWSDLMETSQEFLYDFTRLYPLCRCRGLKTCPAAREVVPFMSPQQMNEFGKRRDYSFYPHISDIWTMYCTILTMSCSPSKAAFQAFCMAQHYSSGRSKETWVRLLQGRTEWWKMEMWQCCISSIGNNSKLLPSHGSWRAWAGHHHFVAVSRYYLCAQEASGCCYPNL